VIPRNKVLKKNKISVPSEINAQILKIKNVEKTPDVYPVVKYIFIAKTFESKKSYKIHGIPRRTKCYGVGILTTKNKYYFSELHTRHKDLTAATIDIFKTVFITHYIITKDTRILTTENINPKNDPILNFIKIVSTTVGCNVKTSNVLQMLKPINLEFRYVAAKRNYSITKWHKNKLIQRLIDMDRFDFIVEPGWKEKLSLMTAHIREAFITCAVGMLYMYIRDIDMQRKKTYKANKIKRQLAETTQIDKYNTINKENI